MQALTRLAGAGWGSDGAGHNLHNRNCCKPASRGSIRHLQPSGSASTSGDVRVRSTAGRTSGGLYRCFQRIWNLVKLNLLREYDADLLRPAFEFLRFFATSFELCAVNRSVFCHLSPRFAPRAPQFLPHDLRRHCAPSPRPARSCVSYLLCPA